MVTRTVQGELFAAAPALPAGMRYERDFLTPAEEQHWIAFAQAQPLAEMNYKGFLAKRRVVSFGGRYDYGANRLDEGPPIPAELDPLREKVAAWLGVEPSGSRRCSWPSTARAPRWAGTATCPTSRTSSGCRSSRTR